MSLDAEKPHMIKLLGPDRSRASARGMYGTMQIQVALLVHGTHTPSTRNLITI